MPPPATTQAAARFWIHLNPPFPVPRGYHSSVEITRTLWWQTRFTRGRVREWKGGHKSVTVQNRTHVYMNFFDHKDLGNHLLQLCPKVVKHPVLCKLNTRNMCGQVHQCLSTWRGVQSVTLWLTNMGNLYERHISLRVKAELIYAISRSKYSFYLLG
jgi:hypothetical protein